MFINLKISVQTAAQLRKFATSEKILEYWYTVASLLNEHIHVHMQVYFMEEDAAPAHCH